MMDWLTKSSEKKDDSNPCEKYWRIFRAARDTQKEMDNNELLNNKIEEIKNNKLKPDQDYTEWIKLNKEYEELRSIGGNIYGLCNTKIHESNKPLLQVISIVASEPRGQDEDFNIWDTNREILFKHYVYNLKEKEDKLRKLISEWRNNLMAATKLAEIILYR